MDTIIQKATELGASRIIPFVSSRSIPQLTGEKATAKHQRWEKIAIEASEQCGRTGIPRLSPLAGFNEMLTLPQDTDLKIILWEAETRQGLKSILQNPDNRRTGNFFIVIGPEGGFSHDEIDRATRKGFLTASLGNNILRVETSSLAVLSILQYEKGIIGETEAEKETV
jgi:16S rRNA (uracil1498-N3)-methyltransferase